MAENTGKPKTKEGFANVSLTLPNETVAWARSHANHANVSLSTFIDDILFAESQRKGEIKIGKIIRKNR